MTMNPTTLLRSVRDEVRERRSARAEYRALKAALAGYNSPSDIDDLLHAADGEGPDATAVREILSGNLRRYHLTHSGTVPGLRLGA